MYRFWTLCRTFSSNCMPTCPCCPRSFSGSWFSGRSLGVTLTALTNERFRSCLPEFAVWTWKLLVSFRSFVAIFAHIRFVHRFFSAFSALEWTRIWPITRLSGSFPMWLFATANIHVWIFSWLFRGIIFRRIIFKGNIFWTLDQVTTGNGGTRGYNDIQLTKYYKQCPYFCSFLWSINKSH